MTDDMRNRPAMSERAWHAMALDAVFGALASRADGLSPDEAAKRLGEHGPNELRAAARPGVGTFILGQLKSPLIYLLIGAAVVSALVGHPLDAAVIAGVVVLNTILGVMQEWKAEKALEALQSMVTPVAKVLRGGAPGETPTTRIVPGDIILIETGDKVAADARLIASTDLHVDESSLTGESEPAEKRAGETDEAAALADRDGMVWMGTAVTAGRGRAVVVETGMRTVMGRIAGQVQSTERSDTPLQRRMHALATTLGVAAVALAGVVFGMGLLRGYEAVEMLLFSVATAVSAIPEGLPAVISVTLALGVTRMARKNAIIRKLTAVETLGSTTVICTDKTGTLTRNEMTVRAVWTPGAEYEVTGEGYAPQGEVRSSGSVVKLRSDGAGDDEPLSMLLSVGALCNNAVLASEEGRWTVTGTPTEGALMAVARKAGIDPGDAAKGRPRLDEVPFASERKYMATLHGSPGGERLVMVKGAPERVIGFCTHVWRDGRAVELTDAERGRIEERNTGYAGEAMRVVAAAVKVMPAGTDRLTPEDAESGLAFVGLWALMDPPRPEAGEAVAEARRAGIRVIMITGDQPVTARAIAGAVGIVRGDEYDVVTGAELEAMADEELDRRIGRIGVFARVSPSHKMRIVHALRRAGETVAMTGDGVNDAPALKNAHIGVAMGRTGTEVAKEAADMVLTDDNFATIVHAVEEGRVIFANLRRVVFFLITTNAGEVLTLVAALAVGLPLPLVAVMILWVNLVTDGACTIPLGLEPMHGDVLTEPPRRKSEGILDGALLVRIALLAAVMAAGTLLLFWYELGRYASDADGLDHARTIAFTTLVAFQWWNALNARTSMKSFFSAGLFSNGWLMLGIGAAIVLQLLPIYWGPAQTAFRTVALNLEDWGMILLTTASIFVLDEVLKVFGLYAAIRRRWGAKVGVAAPEPEEAA